MKKKIINIAILSALVIVIVVLGIIIISMRHNKKEEVVFLTDEEGTPNYVIIYGKDNESWAKESAELLSSKIYDITHIQLEVKDDGNEIQDNEIRIGVTNRSQSNYLDTIRTIGADGFDILLSKRNSIDIIALSQIGANGGISALLNKYLVKDNKDNFLFKNITEYISMQKNGTEPDTSLLSIKHPLRFDANGNFKILMVSDVCAEEDVSDYTVSALNEMIEAESPDLVLLCGNIQNKINDKSTLKKLITKISEPMESRQIPWAHVFGIEDYNSGMQLDLQFEVYSEFEYCISKKASNYKKSVTNYFLPVLSSQSDTTAFGIWGFDSSERMLKPLDDTEYLTSYNSGISFEQINWYMTNSSALEKQFGQVVPSIMFLNTPISEFANINDLINLSGIINENVSYPDINSGLFSVAKKNNDILGIYCGTNHLNDFSGKYYDIEFGCLASIGYDGYGLGGDFDTNNSMRGGRIIEINENDITGFSSKMIYAKDYGISRD